MEQQAEEPSRLAQCCNGLLETKKSWALQDHGYMIWAPEETSRVSTAEATTSPRTLVWWDMESSPPPTTESYNSWDEIALHLARMLALPNCTSRELVTCIAYGAAVVPERLLHALRKRGVVVHRRNLPTCTLPGAGTTLGMKSMIVDILFWALNNAPPAEARIISATTTDSEPNFPKLLRGLHRRGYTVHLASSIATSTLDNHPPIANGESNGQCSESPSHCTSFGNGECSEFPSRFTSFGNGECSESPSRITNFWNSFRTQVPDSSEQQPLSFAQLQLLHSCLCGMHGPQGPSLSRPTYKEIIVASGGGDHSHGSKPQASMDDVRLWLETFVELEESLLGMNISLVPKSFEKQGMKLDHKHLGALTLSRLLLENFSDLVRLRSPSKDCTVMFPTKLGAQPLQRLIMDFTNLLAELLPNQDSESPMSLVKTAFKARFGYDLEHEAAGYVKLNQFLGSMPKVVRVRQCSSQGKELAICRPGGYYSKQRTSPDYNNNNNNNNNKAYTSTS